MTQRLIFSFEIAHGNQVRLKICHHFSFTNNKSIIQKTILFPWSSTGSVVTQKLYLEWQMLWTWDEGWNILLPKLDNICKNQVSSIFQFLVVFKGLKYDSFSYHDVYTVNIFNISHRNVLSSTDRFYPFSSLFSWITLAFFTYSVFNVFHLYNNTNILIICT